MFDIMQNVLLIFLEIICCKIFYETFEEIRYKGWINIVQFILFLSSMCLLAYGFSKYFAIRQIAVILMFSVFMLWHVKISLKKSLILAVLYDALLLAVDYLLFSIVEWLFLGSELSEQQYEIGGILAYLLGKVILFFLVLLIRKKFGKKSVEMMVDTEWLRFLFFPVFTIAVISVMLSSFKDVTTVEEANLLAIIAFGMVGMNIVVFYLINDIVEREMKMHENQGFRF